MKKRIFSIMFFAVMLSVLVLPTSAAQLSEEQQTALEISYLINEYRAENGLYQYVYNSTLASVAQAHTEYQVSIGESTHYGEGRSTSKDRVTASGYGGGSYIFTSEMIYAGSFATPKAAVEWWKNSPIHNAIMLSTDYHEFGVGVRITDERKYYTVNVAAIRGVTAPGVGSAPIEPTLSVSAPVTVAEPNQDGSIIHIVDEGQTIQGIAEAYGVPADQLLLYNSMTASTALSPGQIILVKLPVVQPTIVVEESQSAPEPTEDLQVIPTEDSETSATATPMETVAGEGEQPSGQDSGNNLVLILVGVVVVAAIAFAVISFLRLKKTVDEEEQEDEGDGHLHHDRGKDHDTSAFHHQPRNRQFELLREVAEMALDAYPLDVITIEPLRYVLNAEFLVDARPKDGMGDVEQFVVRVNAPGFNSKAEISSEMEWLFALKRDTSLKVPFPIRTQSGDWVETVTLAPVGEPRHCVLFKYLPGEMTEFDTTPAHFEVIGAMIAQLHKHGASFDPPSGFSRKHWDLKGLKGGMLDVSAEKAYNALTENERKVVDAAEKFTEAAIDKLGANDQVYGLIHGDLHMKSFSFYEGQPLIQDFDTCGYGYYIYDLSVVVWDVFHRDDFASLKEALLRGYRSERPISEEEEKYLMYFVAGRLMSQILAWAGRRDDPNLEEAADKAISEQTKQLVALLRMLVS